MLPVYFEILNNTHPLDSIDSVNDSIRGPGILSLFHDFIFRVHSKNLPVT